MIPRRGLNTRLGDKRDILWLYQNLGKRWMLRLERTPGTGYNELGIRYKLHDFLSAEYVISNKEHWLRLGREFVE